MGINMRMAWSILADAGMGEAQIVAALASLKPVATLGGAPYFNPAHVSRIARKKTA